MNLNARLESFREIMKTEKKYIANLRLIIHEYLHPLRAGLSKKAYKIDHSDIAAIFSNIENIYEIHQDFFQKLQQYEENWPFIDNIGSIFIDLAPSLKNYALYVKNFKYALDTLNRCQQEDEKLSLFLQEVFFSYLFYSI
jgi:hypothetical protein